MMKRSVSVVVLNYNGWQDTIECVQSLLNLANPANIIIVDNCSSDNSIDKLAQWLKNIPAANAQYNTAGPARLDFLYQEINDGDEASVISNMRQPFILFIKSADNRGYAAGNNIGINYALKANSHFFWILNNDTTVESSALEFLIARMDENHKIGLCGSKILYYENPQIVQALGGGKFHLLRGRSSLIGMNSYATDHAAVCDVEKQLSFISGASTLVRREFIEDIGQMCEDYFLYWEEIDWAFRGRKKYKLGYAPKSIVYHKAGASIGTRDNQMQSVLADFYMRRSQFIFCSRYSPFSILPALVHAMREAFINLRRRDGLRFIHIFQSIMRRHYPADRFKS